MTGVGFFILKKILDVEKENELNIGKEHIKKMEEFKDSRLAKNYYYHTITERTRTILLRYYLSDVKRLFGI